MMIASSVMICSWILLLFYISCCYGSSKCYQEVPKANSTLQTEFNAYVDQVIYLLNSKQNNSSLRLQNQYVTDSWGYLLLNNNYSMRLTDGVASGMGDLQRTGNSTIAYNPPGNLTITTTVMIPNMEARYNMELIVDEIKSYASISCQLSELSVTVGLSVSDATLRVTLDSIHIDMTQSPKVTVKGLNPIVAYFCPSIEENIDLFSRIGLTATRSTVLTVVNMLNDPNFAYY